MNNDLQQHSSESRNHSGCMIPFLTIILIGLIFLFFFGSMNLQNNGNGYGKGTGSGFTSGFGFGSTKSGDGSSSAGSAKTDETGSAAKKSNQTASIAETQQKKAASDTNSPNVANLKGNEKTKSPNIKTVRVKERLIHLTEPASPNVQTDGDDDKGDGFSSGHKGGDGFYGITVLGNTIFIVDVSGSMVSSTREGLRCIDILKVQLRNAIYSSFKKSLKTKYCIITFSSNIQIFPPKRLKHFSDGWDRDVKNFITALHADGGTDLLGAIQNAIQIMRDEDNNINTIFLLTDGEPNSGWCDIEDLIYNKIKKKIVINCISIGRKCPEMEKIAKDYKGTYKEIL